MLLIRRLSVTLTLSPWQQEDTDKARSLALSWCRVISNLKALTFTANASNASSPSSSPFLLLFLSLLSSYSIVYHLRSPYTRFFTSPTFQRRLTPLLWNFT
ncbi:hypothetical protein E2C01_094557 [Portunus trituberculatus]|uniref:Uncharacterized protein n=1 Tax=Portunus trituberculatus TaxID=210409 RepID=A0A5B7JMF7_PORTR|nr:hypothetical protein [Portunus trituberculatus]